RASVRLSIGTTPSVALNEARALVMASGFRQLDYVSLVDPDTLFDLPDAPLAPGTVARLLGAAWTGKTRLIDNISATR
ncbi:pantoate--beta-alanine ligase, partial [Hyphomonas sp.]|uniref:pantoate--beta-alanine ligase n=1 Tax=Hyphomonas sp. TaxID=87 RepID=UPI0039E6FC7A